MKINQITQLSFKQVEMYRYRNQIFVLLLTTTFYLQGCDAILFKNGNGEMVVNSRRVEPFTSIYIEGNFEVILEKNDQPGVVIKVDENLLEYIEVDSKHDVLSIYSTERIRSKDGIKVMISYTEIEEITVSGACGIYTETPLNTEHLDVNMSGASIVEMELNVKYLQVMLSGAGILDIGGKTHDLKVTLSGAGSFNGSALETKNAVITISGVGGAKVNVTGDLSATVSGIGGVEYQGHPKTIKKNISGIGKIFASRK